MNRKMVLKIEGVKPENYAKLCSWIKTAEEAVRDEIRRTLPKKEPRKAEVTYQFYKRPPTVRVSKVSGNDAKWLDVEVEIQRFVSVEMVRGFTHLERFKFFRTPMGFVMKIVELLEGLAPGQKFVDDPNLKCDKDL